MCIENSPDDTINGHYYNSLNMTKTFYNSCMNETQIEQDSFSAHFDYLKNIFQYDDYVNETLFTSYNLKNVTSMYKPLLETWYSCPLFKLEIYLNYKSTSDYIIYVSLFNL